MFVRIFEEQGVSLSSDLVKGAIERSLRQVFGAIGGAIPFEILEVKQTTAQSFVKVDKRCAITPFYPSWQLQA